MEIKAIVESGFKEGSYYVEKYNPYFMRELGFSAYPGTLNVRTGKIKLPAGKIIHPANGFKVRYIKIKIHGLEGAIVIPEKSRHPKNIWEIISPVNLKKALNIKDGDKICIKLA